MKDLFRPAIGLFVLLSIITGLAYPAAVTVITQTLFHNAASGSMLFRDGKPVGSQWIGQNFAEPKNFWGRPSATAPQPYNATASGGSNQGPLNPALPDAVKARIDALKAADPNNQLPLPADLVTASASGLDPHISPAAARYQVARIAAARGLSPERLNTLIAAHTEDRQWGLFGEPRVNVLELNLALDSIH
jgi:K+-transporting ATPase ATPase C chain